MPLYIARTLASAVGCLVACCFTSLLSAEEAAPAANAHGIVQLDYPASTTPGELACTAHYYLWLPPGVKTVRAILVHQHGCGDGAAVSNVSAARDLHWQELARKWDCALLGTSYQGADKSCAIWSNPANGSDARFQQALADLAKQTGHAELTTVPWCLWGHSGGGWWSSLMLAKYPNRVVAAWLRSGTSFGKQKRPDGAEAAELSAAVYQVPVLCNPGLQEKGDMRFNGAYVGSVEMLNAWREKGALIAFAADPKSSHDCGGSRYLAIPWFDACLAARLPAEVGQPLKAMPTSGAWLAPATGGKPLPTAEYQGEIADSAWLPNAAVAKIWEEYVRTGAVTDTTPPPAPVAVKAKAIDKAIELTWEVRADFESGLRGFVVLRDGVVVAELSTGKPDADNKVLFQGMSYHDTPKQPVAELKYTDAAPQPGVQHRYQITAVNTAGLKSVPAVAE